MHNHKPNLLVIFCDPDWVTPLVKALTAFFAQHPMLEATIADEGHTEKRLQRFVTFAHKKALPDLLIPWLNAQSGITDFLIIDLLAHVEPMPFSLKDEAPPSR